jgi:soluble lytic murein transglycosylase-like protein
VGALRLWAAAAALAFASPAHAESVADWQPYIAEASARFGVPTAWIEAVMHAESRGRTTLNGRPIRSSAGAIGLMQLMPATWAEMRARLALGGNPDDPRDNILAGTFYLRLMYDRFGYPGLFAAYNAGPGRYAEHLAGRRALPAETVGYLAAVAPSGPRATVAAARLSLPASIFAVRKDGPSVVPAEGADRPASALFVALSQPD